MGVVKGWRVGPSVWRSALETLLTGGAAAELAYAVGAGLRQRVGADAGLG